MIAETKPYVPCLTFASLRREKKKKSESSFSKFQFRFLPDLVWTRPSYEVQMQG